MKTTTIVDLTRTAQLSAAAFELALATRTLPIAGGLRSVTLRPKRALLGRPAKAVSLRLRIVVVDGARNRRTVIRVTTVIPPLEAARR
jgi:hypothetical protein